MNPRQLDQQRAVVAAYQQQTTALRARLAQVVTASWHVLGNYRTEQQAAFTGRVVPVVEGAMQQMQAVTAAYLATLAGISGASFTPASSPTVTISAVRNGADPADVYGRPFQVVWRQLAANAPLNTAKVSAAIQSGLARAVQTAVTDLQLAKTHTSQDQIGGSRTIVGYRRQLEPNACALCIVASTRTYSKAELMPLHPVCDCSPVPIYAGQPATVPPAPAALAQMQAAVAAQFGADSQAARDLRAALMTGSDPGLYRSALVDHHHGEIGPLLGVRGQHFTTVADLPAA